MAELSSDGIDDLIKAMQRADIFDEATQTELLQAGAEHFRDIVRQEVNRAAYDLKFVSSKLSKQKKAKRDKDGNYYMTVTVTGKNERGERNANKLLHDNRQKEAQNPSHRGGNSFYSRGIHTRKHSRLSDVKPSYGDMLTGNERQ